MSELVSSWWGSIVISLKRSNNNLGLVDGSSCGCMSAYI
jgi:hypothetical protein